MHSYVKPQVAYEPNNKQDANFDNSLAICHGAFGLFILLLFSKLTMTRSNMYMPVLYLY